MRVSRSTSSSKPSRPSKSSVKLGEKTILRRKRFWKSSYGSKNIKQEQTRNSTPKVQNVWYTRGRETPNVKKQDTKFITAAGKKHVQQFENN